MFPGLLIRQHINKFKNTLHLLKRFSTWDRRQCIWAQTLGKLNELLLSLLNFVPYTPTCQRVLRVYVLLCQRALRAYMLTCQHVLRVYMLSCHPTLRAHVPTCLACLRAQVSTFSACLRAHVPTCLASLRARVPTCFACLRAYVFTCQRTFRAFRSYVPTCSRADIFVIVLSFFWLWNKTVIHSYIALTRRKPLMGAMTDFAQ